MEGVFTFVGSITGHGNGLVVGHLILVTLVIGWLVMRATGMMRAVPTGVQNVMEAYLGGVIAMGRDVIEIFKVLVLTLMSQKTGF